MECILKGDISITDNIQFIADIINSPPSSSVKVIRLEEVPTIDTGLPNVIGGAILLPPIEAYMAASNGDEALFTQFYVEHLNTPVVVEFISLLMAALYRGTSLILFYPEDDLELKGKILEMFYKRYGIAIGEIGIRRCSYDLSCTPIFLESIFSTGAMDPFELLYLYPDEALLTDRLIYKLVLAIMPIGENYQEKAKYIVDLKRKLKEKRNLVIPFIDCSMTEVAPY